MNQGEAQPSAGPQNTGNTTYEAFEAGGAWGVQNVMHIPVYHRGERVSPGILYDAMFTEQTARRLAALSTQFPERDWNAQSEVLKSEGFDLGDPSDPSYVPRCAVPIDLCTRLLDSGSYIGDEGVPSVAKEAAEEISRLRVALSEIHQSLDGLGAVLTRETTIGANIDYITRARYFAAVALGLQPAFPADPA
ncbi:TPA: hypothetical protein ACYLN4_000541 [Burkholderia lata]